jgi:hypothetical protein
MAKLLKESLKIVPLAGTKSENLYIDRSKERMYKPLQWEGTPLSKPNLVGDTEWSAAAATTLYVDLRAKNKRKHLSEMWLKNKETPTSSKSTRLKKKELIGLPQ